MKMSNRTEGNAFEREVCGMLGAHGFWAHSLVQSKDGQPADIIACKAKAAPVLIDCKICKNDRFVFSRVEENQRKAMAMFENIAGGLGFFCVRFGNGKAYMIDYKIIVAFENAGDKSISTEECATEVYFNSIYPLEEWLEKYR